MTSLLHRFSEFLKEDNGNNSSIRLVMLVWGIGTFVVWMVLSFVHGSLAAVPESVVAVFAATITGKVVQKFVESDK